MPYQDDFLLLWEQVKQSVEEGTFAKLTMAKTIGKRDLKNIFLRPIYAKGGFSVMLKYHYRMRDVEDVEEEFALEEAFKVIESHLKDPFFSVLLFTTTKDLLLKINKKGLGSITENPPTFKNIIQAEPPQE